MNHKNYKSGCFLAFICFTIFCLIIFLLFCWIIVDGLKNLDNQTVVENSVNQPITENIEVDVTIVDENCQDSWVQIVPVGKVVIPITHPAEYEVTIEYDGERYIITDEETCNLLKDKVGETTKAICNVTTYNDGKKDIEFVRILEG